MFAPRILPRVQIDGVEVDNEDDEEEAEVILGSIAPQCCPV